MHIRMQFDEEDLKVSMTENLANLTPSISWSICLSSRGMSMPMQWQNKAKKVCKSTGFCAYKSNIKVWDVEFVQNLQNFLLQCFFVILCMALLLLAGKEAKEQSGYAYNNIKNGVS